MGTIYTENNLKQKSNQKLSSHAKKYHFRLHTHFEVRLLTYTVIVNLMKHRRSKASIPLIASSIWRDVFDIKSKPSKM